MQEIIRGSVVQFFGIQFRDADKQPTVPDSAVIRVRYLRCGCERIDEVALTNDGGTFSGAWDSSPADPGTIYWSLRAVAPEAVAKDGQFRLKANFANERGAV